MEEKGKKNRQHDNAVSLFPFSTTAVAFPSSSFFFSLFISLSLFSSFTFQNIETWILGRQRFHFHETYVNVALNDRASALQPRVESLSVNLHRVNVGEMDEWMFGGCLLESRRNRGKKTWLDRFRWKRLRLALWVDWIEGLGIFPVP